MLDNVLIENINEFLSKMNEKIEASRTLGAKDKSLRRNRRHGANYKEPPNKIPIPFSRNYFDNNSGHEYKTYDQVLNHLKQINATLKDGKDGAFSDQELWNSPEFGEIKVFHPDPSERGAKFTVRNKLLDLRDHLDYLHRSLDYDKKRMNNLKNYQIPRVTNPEELQQYHINEVNVRLPRQIAQATKEYEQMKANLKPSKI